MSLGRHGLSRTVEYRAWISLKNRCFNKNNKDYKNYGGRGIIVCDRWKNDPVQFIKDMGLKPSPEHSIDRIDNNGNYEPNNCRWATIEQQNSNRRFTGFVGEDNPRSKLTEGDVRQIWIMLIEGKKTQKGIGDIFGIQQTTVYDIKIGKLWSHLKPKNIYFKKKRRLSPEEVKEIHYLLKGGILQKDIAQRFNVKPCTISNIKSGRNWAKING